MLPDGRSPRVHLTVAPQAARPSLCTADGHRTHLLQLSRRAPSLSCSDAHGAGEPEGGRRGHLQWRVARATLAVAERADAASTRLAHPALPCCTKLSEKACGGRLQHLVRPSEVDHAGAGRAGVAAASHVRSREVLPSHVRCCPAT
eukprot:92216-Rhodomonas_salina.1